MANGLINIQTDLTSLKYSTIPLGSDTPYVTKNIDNPPSSNQVAIEITKRIDDTSRIAKMLIDKPGIKYLLHEAELQQIGAGDKINKARKGGKTLTGAVLQQIGKTVVSTLKIAASTLAQIPVNGTGTHFIKGFRTDTYLQPTNGNQFSGFAQFFGAGGVEGAPLALQGKTIDGVVESQFFTQGSTVSNGAIINPNDATVEPKFAYNSKVQGVGEATLSTNEKPNASLPENDANRLSAYNAVEGNPITVGYKKPITFGKPATKELGDLSPTIARGVQTTATPGVGTFQNSIKSRSNKVAPKDWISPDSINNISSGSYSYTNTYTGHSASISILNAQEGNEIPVILTPEDPGLDRLNDGEQKYSEFSTYTGGPTDKIIDRVLKGKRVSTNSGERHNELYLLNNSDYATDGNHGVVVEDLQDGNGEDIYPQGATIGETSIPKLVSLSKLAYQINTGSADVVSRDGLL